MSTPKKPPPPPPEEPTGPTDNEETRQRQAEQQQQNQDRLRAGLSDNKFVRPAFDQKEIERASARQNSDRDIAERTRVFREAFKKDPEDAKQKEKERIQRIPKAAQQAEAERKQRIQAAREAAEQQARLAGQQNITGAGLGVKQETKDSKPEPDPWNMPTRGRGRAVEQKPENDNKQPPTDTGRKTSGLK